jgi:hypothetical protein
MRLAILTSLALPMLALAAQRVEVATTEKSDFAPGGTVRIEHSTGELNVEGWDEPSVQIEVTRYAWAAKANLKQIQVTKKLEGNVLTIDTAHKRFTGAHVDYRIRVPRNTKLVIHHGIGDVTIYGMSGDIDASAKDGDLVVGLPEPAKYEIDAFTKLGGVYSDFAGPSRHRRLGMGESLNPAPEGTGDTRHISLHVGTGGISIVKEPKEAA